jgi:hypothetical protein
MQLQRKFITLFLFKYYIRQLLVVYRMCYITYGGTPDEKFENP